MFKKLTKVLSTGLEKVVDYAQTQVVDTLSRRYPDIDEVLTVLEGLTGNQHLEAIEGPKDLEVEQEDHVDDGRWRPVLLTVGLLYKLQKLQNSSWYNNEDILVKDDEKEKCLLLVFGFYWQLILEVATVLRSSELDQTDLDAIKEALAIPLQPHSIEVVYGYSTDANLVEKHCPDFALLLDHPHQTIVINICGTRMIPAPKMSDVFMDLYATAEPFLHGKAHKGMDF